MKTDFLYDNGEENWEFKVHCGCGGIFLKDSGSGYQNIDIDGTYAFEDEETARRNTADIRDYYANLEGDMNNLPARRKTVVDGVSDWVDLPYAPNSVDKIVAIQTLEHVTSERAREALRNWWNVLKPDGVLIVSVPDTPQTIQLLKQSDARDFAIRHLQGSLKTEYAVHKAWYSADSLEETLKALGFYKIEHLPNFHVYPAVVIKARKQDFFIPDRSYQFPLPEYDASCTRILDVGPGDFPLPFATRCFDKDDFYKNSRIVPCDVGDIYRMPYEDNEWDYLYSSHCLEHLECPEKALKELVRVSKRGYVEVPSAMLDFLMQHGHDYTHPYWMNLQSDNTIVMVQKTKEMQPAFTNDDMGAYVHRITQYPIELSEPERHVREHFWKHQKILNVSASWNKETGKRANIIEIRNAN